MLPILPALILLLLHGPSHLERLAREGQLPVGLEKIRREFTARPHPSAQESRLAAMLASGDEAFSSALMVLLQPKSVETPIPPTATATVLPSRPEFRARQGAIADGFGKGFRTRDGPTAATSLA